MMRKAWEKKGRIVIEYIVKRKQHSTAILIERLVMSRVITPYAVSGEYLHDICKQFLIEGL